MRSGTQRSWSSCRAAAGGQSARLSLHSVPINIRSSRRYAGHRHKLPQQPCLSRNLVTARAIDEQVSNEDQPSRVWTLQDLLEVPDEGAKVQQHQQDTSSTSTQSTSQPPMKNAARDNQQHLQSPASSAADGFPAQQWSQDQQEKQRYRQQQWQLWNARQQQLERGQRLQAWQQAQQQQLRQTSEITGGSDGQAPYSYDETRWQVRSKEWRAGPPPRYPLGRGNPSYIIDQLPSSTTDSNSSIGVASSQHSSHDSHLRLGEKLDKHLCFYGSCSLAVLQPQVDAELALAAISVAMREMHRCSGSTIMFQVLKLKPCSAVPQPPSGSLLLLLQRVLRPVPLPVAKQQPLFANQGVQPDFLADAATRGLLYGSGCASIVMKATGVASSEGSLSAVATALQAVQQASSILRTLYNRDCVVYAMWKTVTQDAAAPANPDAAVLRETEGEAQGSSPSLNDASASDLCEALQPQQQQRQRLTTDQPNISSAEPGQSVFQQQQMQQQQQQVVLPHRSYKLLLISCDVGLPTSGWHQPGVQQSQPWRKPRGLPDDEWEKQQQWRQQQQRNPQQHSPAQQIKGDAVRQESSREDKS